VHFNICSTIGSSIHDRIEFIKLKHDLGTSDERRETKIFGRAITITEARGWRWRRFRGMGSLLARVFSSAAGSALVLNVVQRIVVYPTFRFRLVAPWTRGTVNEKGRTR
jgi:hypothetical protein